MKGKIIFYFGAKKENIGFALGDMADTITIEVTNVDATVNDIIESNAQWITINSPEGHKHINKNKILWFDSIPDKEEQ